MRRLEPRLAFAFASLIAALAIMVGTAGANIDPAGYQTISPFNRCPEFGGPGVRPFGADQEGLGVRLKYGWAAKNTSQLDKFVRVQSGTVTLTGPNGFQVSDTWSKGDASGWTAYTQITATAPNGKTVPAYETHRYTNFGNLAAGSYSLTMDLRIASDITDGWTPLTGPSSWLKVTNCSVTVDPAP